MIIKSEGFCQRFEYKIIIGNLHFPHKLSHTFQFNNCQQQGGHFLSMVSMTMKIQ